MFELVEFIVRELVDSPDEVEVTELERGRLTVFQIQVDPDDLGKVIGRQGRIANALRTVIGSVRGEQGIRYSVEIMS